MRTFPLFLQRDIADCGPSCLKMVTQYFGRNFTIQYLRDICNISSSGVNFLDISEAAEKIGLRALGAKLSVKQLKTVGGPCILHWRQNHFVILYKVKRNKFYIADPASGMQELNEQELANLWLPSREFEDGNALILSTTPRFFQNKEQKDSKLDWSFITGYLLSYKPLLMQLCLALLVGTLVQLVTPFLTGSIVDVGISTKDIGFVNLILIAQVTLFVSSTTVDFIRSWILLHISTRVNIAILTDFLIKLMKLPMSFYDTKSTGDIMQRINDEKRIETFLTGSVLSAIFSMFTFVVFAVVIFFYNFTVFAIFMITTAIYVAWISFFLKRRRKLDYKQFSNYALNQDNLMELVNGMPEIKLNNSERHKRWKWEHVQARLFKFSVKTLALDQYQQAGAMFINQIKNIFISYLSARLVIEGNLTLGSMVAIQYIIGQLNGPVEQFITFVKSYQYAKISIERLNEINALEDEEPAGQVFVSELPDDKTIRLNNITFTYPGAGNEPALKDIDLTIPAGKTTAIVGMSGSGKTTLLKLLLRFYHPGAGEITVGDTRLDTIKFRTWRDDCSMVMQEGYIFSDTLAGNIAVGEDAPAPDKLDKAIKIANLSDVIDALPYGIRSRIGNGGNGVSQGQKQRILIARAVYKNPGYLFFDEATNALDANNEKAIVENLAEFLYNKTVVVVAHRLSTVKNADNIIVLEKGKIVEQGTHEQLIKIKQKYFDLVKNQLELGN